MVVLENGTTKEDIHFYDLSILGDFAHDYKDNADRSTDFNKIVDIVKNNMFGGSTLVRGHFDYSQNLTLTPEEKLEIENQKFLVEQRLQLLELYVRPIFDKLFYELQFYYFAFSYDDNTATFGNRVNKEHFLEHFSDKNPKNYLYNNFLRILVEKFEKAENYALMESFTNEELETLWGEINEQHGGNDDFPYIILPVDTTALTGIKGTAFVNKTGHITIKKISNDKFIVGVPIGSGFDPHQGTHSSTGKAGTAKDIVKFMQETFADDGENGSRANAIKAFNVWHPKAVVPDVSASSDTTPSKKRRADSPATPPSKKSAIASDVTNKNFVDIILKFFVEKVFKIDVKEDNEEDLMLRSQKFAIKNILDNKAMTSVDETILRGVENVVSFNATEMVQDDTKPGSPGISSVTGGNQDTQLLKDIESTRKINETFAKYVIDNAGSANHGFQDLRAICPLSQVMDGITDMTEHVCKPQFDIDDYKNHTLSKNTSPGPEYGNMLVHLKDEQDDKNSVELSRIFKPGKPGTPASLDLKIVFKNDGNKFESTMSIVKSETKGDVHDAWYRNTITVDNKEYVNVYIRVNNDMGSYMTIKAANVYKNATLLLTDIYKDLPANKEERRIKLIACAYGCLVFKSLGDIMQEWNGVLKGGGYVKDETGVYQAPTYKEAESIFKHTDKNSEPLRVMLTGDRPSGARVLWSLHKGKEQDGWKEYINSNCFGGYVAQPGMNLEGEERTSGEKIYIPVHNYFLFNPRLNKVYTFKTGNTILRPNGNDANEEIRNEIIQHKQLVAIPKNTRDWNSTYHPIVPALLNIPGYNEPKPKITRVVYNARVTHSTDKHCKEFTYNSETYMLQLINKKLSNTTIWCITDRSGNSKIGTKSSFTIPEEAFKDARTSLNQVAEGYVYDGTDYCIPESSSGSSSGNASSSETLDYPSTVKSYKGFIKRGNLLSENEKKRFIQIAKNYVKDANSNPTLSLETQINIIDLFNNPDKRKQRAGGASSTPQEQKDEDNSAAYGAIAIGLIIGLFTGFKV